MNERVVEERLEKLSQMLESVTGYIENLLDNLDVAIPDQAKKMIIDIIESKETKAIVDSIKNRRPPRIVLMGRSGVGKSSLINAMFGSYLAETSAVDVGTLQHGFFQYTKDGKVIFEIIDTRGISENLNKLSNSAEDDLDHVIEDFRPDAFLFLTNGADRSTLRKDAEELKKRFNRMKLKPPLITVITRVDELDPSRIKDPKEYTDQKLENIKLKRQQVQHVLNDVGLSESFIVPVSAYVEWNHESPKILTVEEREKLSIAFDGRYNIDELINVLEDNIDFSAAIDLMFNRRIDLAIEKIADKFVQSFSLASLAIGASPIPVADILILLPIQIVEVVLIGYLSGNKVDAKSAREFIVSLGAVFLFGFSLKFVAQQGVKLLNVVPGAGSAISGSVAYSGTYSIGKAAIAYYIKGDSLEEAKQEAVAAKKELETSQIEEVLENRKKDEEYESKIIINDERLGKQEEKKEPKSNKKKKEQGKIKLNTNMPKEVWDKVKTKWPRKK